ncbi:MAG: asparaginase [Pseudomonadota bacterium]
MSEIRTPGDSGVLAARVYRGHQVEAWHRASIVVVEGDGAIRCAAGDPDLVTLGRSSLKPLQLFPLLASGAADHFCLAPEQLAIMAGSHTGTDAHRAVVDRNLRASQHGAGHLQCGSHWPLWMQEQKLFPTGGEERDPLRHNCSGKHSGFLALARHLGDASERYLDPDSPTQRQVRQALSDLCEVELSSLEPAVDGCSAPNYALPLVQLARAYLKLARARADRSVEQTHLARIRGAMLAHPEMVSGQGRLDLDLACALPGRLVAKIGAEAIELIALAEPELAIAIKVHDGNMRALGAICVEVLCQLGVLDPAHLPPSLQRHARPEVRNDRGLLSGHLEACLRLRTV